MEFDEDDPQAIRLAYVDWRLRRLWSDLDHLDDDYASPVMAKIEQAWKHLPEDVAGGSVDDIAEARDRVPNADDPAKAHLAVAHLCRTVLSNCEGILHDYLDIHHADFPGGEGDYASPEDFPAWSRFRDEAMVAGV